MRIDVGKLTEIVKLNETLDSNTSNEIDKNLEAIKKTDKIPSFNIRGESQLNIDKSILSGLGSLKDIQELAESQDLKTVKAQLAIVSNTMSPENYRKFLEEGYDFNDTEIDTIVTVVDKIQVSLAAYCEDYDGTVDAISFEQIEAAIKNSGQAYKIAKKLKEQNLPVTEDNIEDSLNTLDMAKNLVSLTSGGIKYLISNELTPSIENVYKAEHSGSLDKTNDYRDTYTSADVKGYYSKLTTGEFDWEHLEEQINRIVKETGMEVTKDNISDAKWVVENQLSLTKESLKLLNGLKTLSLPLDEDQAIDYSVKAIKEGKRPMQASLLDTEDLFERASNALEVINNASDEELKSVIASQKDVTIENLSKAQSGEYFFKEEIIMDVSDSKTLTKKELQFVTAKRQLEEVRLRMTVEANVKLLKQGVHIDTELLEGVIEELKQVENNYYKTLLENKDVPVLDENIDLYKETLKQTQTIKDVPSYVLGNAITSKSPLTIHYIYHEGTILKDTLEKAKQSYEVLMTKPRADMGDSIRKAFQNVDAILEDIGMDTTQTNQRAVRILSYNQMEITKESIFTIKQADALVNSLMNNLTPATTLELIRQNINPLNMEIGQLNSKIEEIKNETPLQTEEKYSEFLWKLEKNNEISSEEKQAYIGIYRLLNQIEKTEGGVIGALVNQEAKLTLKNLLSGVRTNKSKGMDISIDNRFGGLEELAYNNPTISEQIEMGFWKNNQEISNTESNNQYGDYYKIAVTQILDEITPSKLQRIEEKGDIYSIPIDELAYEFNQMSSVYSNEDINYQQNQLNELTKLKNIENNVIRMLTDTSQPVTIQNLLSANNMITERGSLYKKLLKEVNKVPVDPVSGGNELLRSFMDVIEGAGESLENKNSMERIYEKLEDISSQTLSVAMKDNHSTSLDLKRIQTLHKEIKFYQDLGKKERYEVPMVIDDEVTSVRLTLVKDSHEKGKVKISLEHGGLGKVAAEFSLTQGKISGYIISDIGNTLDTLKENEEYFVNEIQSKEIDIKKIDYINGKEMDLNQFDLLKEKEEIGTTAITKDLYKIAKAFIVTMKHINREESI